jgi:hypothetical protein
MAIARGEMEDLFCRGKEEKRRVNGAPSNFSTDDDEDEWFIHLIGTI